jgi:hypothetical protein
VPETFVSVAFAFVSVAFAFVSAAFAFASATVVGTHEHILISSMILDLAQKLDVELTFNT